MEGECRKFWIIEITKFRKVPVFIREIGKIVKHWWGFVFLRTRFKWKKIQILKEEKNGPEKKKKKEIP